jgi:hypothetical protein
MTRREAQQFVFTFETGQDTSNIQDLSKGAFGTLIVPAALNGLTVNFLTDMPVSGDLPSNTGFTDIAILSAAKALSTGSNELTAAEIAEVGPAQRVKLKLSAAPGAQTRIVLLWKS